MGLRDRLGHAGRGWCGAIGSLGGQRAEHFVTGFNMEMSRESSMIALGGRLVGLAMIRNFVVKGGKFRTFSDL
jgi:hypothetical protein